jgi:uncharacterized protein YijF (DUF1287 family)
MTSYYERKWTIKEIIQHVIDTERIFSLQSLISRNDKTSLPGFDDENDYISNTDAKTDICKAC